MELTAILTGRKAPGKEVGTREDAAFIERYGAADTVGQLKECEYLLRKNEMLFNMESDEADAQMRDFLEEYTTTVQTAYDYECRQDYVSEFEGMRSMFLTLGGALSFIVGLVGVLNFVNAVLTGIITRKREFAVLQAIGMTGRQLKTMLMLEGLLYTLLSIIFSLLLSLILSPVLGGAVEQMFWFFSCRFTVWPVLLIAPVFVLLGLLIPLLTYRVIARHTIVERLRDGE